MVVGKKVMQKLRLYSFTLVALLWLSAGFTTSYHHKLTPIPIGIPEGIARSSVLDHPSPTIHHLPSGSRFGIIHGIEQDSLLYANGYRFVEENTQQKFSPLNLSRTQFLSRLEKMRAARCSVYAVNVFLPGSLKLVGPQVNENAILEYVDSVFHRCREAGVRIVVLGSGEARKIPEEFDRSVAMRQMVQILGKMGPLAAAQGITVAMENLNRGETNLGNTLKEVTGIIQQVNHPSVRVTADIFHMLKEDETAESIRLAGNLLVHCHIAEERDRARPGRYGEDFRPYFSALKDIGFSGKIMMECGWTDLRTEAGPALEYLERQWEK
jgi:sugar phosphate isomerase/epimerase